MLTQHREDKGQKFDVEEKFLSHFLIKIHGPELLLLPLRIYLEKGCILITTS